MARPVSKHPTELELEILKVLWQAGPSAVREVREALRPRRPLAYTSVMTMMNIMVDKGYLARQKDGGRYVYRPLVSRKATLGGMLRDLVERVFNGSAKAVVANLLEEGQLELQEIDELRTLLSRRKTPRQP